MSTPGQWTLPLAPPGEGAAILIGVSNRAALEQVLGAAWTGGLYLEGPAGAGKSLIAAAWAARAGARVAAAAALDLKIQAELADAKCVAIDGLDGLRPGEGEEAVFHLLNLSARHGGRLLLTGRAAPRTLAIELPDLRTRLNALPVARIEPPDDELLGRLILALAERRQLALPPGVAHFLQGRMARTYRSAINVVEALDRLSLEAGRPVSRELASEALAAAGS